MVDKTLIKTKEEFKQFKKDCWKSDTYTKYHIGKPEKFPCVAISLAESFGNLGVNIYIEDFVYLGDFES